METGAIQKQREKQETITVSSKYPKNSNKVSNQRAPKIGIRAPPKEFLKILKETQKRENAKFTEYRMNLIKYCARRSKMNPSTRETFVNKLITSNDLKKLLFDSSLISSLDQMDGLPKILLTVLSIYLETSITKTDDIKLDG